MAQSNAEILRSGYEAFMAGDIPAVRALLIDEITWHVPGNNPLSGDYTGHDEVLGFLGQLAERSGGTADLHLNDLFDRNDDTVVVLVTLNAERNGKTGAFDHVHVWRLQHGRAVSFRSYQSAGPAEDAFWSS